MAEQVAAPAGQTTHADAINEYPEIHVEIAVNEVQVAAFLEHAKQFEDER